MAATVRRVRTGEVAAFRDLRLRALADAPRAFASTFEEESQLLPRAWEELVARSAEGRLSANFVAEADDGALVGLVGAYRPEPDGHEVELVSMWVAPGARGSGLGAELVRAVLDWADGAGAPRVSLWVTRGNDQAIGLYARMGFEVVPGTQPLPSHPCHEEIRMVRGPHRRQHLPRGARRTPATRRSEWCACSRRPGPDAHVAAGLTGRDRARAGGRRHGRLSCLRSTPQVTGPPGTQACHPRTGWGGR